MWRVDDPDSVRTSPEHEGDVTILSFSPDGKYLVYPTRFSSYM